MTTSLETAEFVVRTIATTCLANEKYFGELDSVVGDGDFGYSLARGFEQVLEHWDEYDRTDAGTFLLKVSVAITSRIGGTSGPIWGTAFMRAGTTLKGSESISGADVVSALRASVEGIKKRGNTDVGDKTLLDSLVPGIDALERSVLDGDSASLALRTVAAATREAADATSTMKALRGRASYSGDRSIGSPDAGAIAMAVLAEKLAEEWPEQA